MGAERTQQRQRADHSEEGSPWVDRGSPGHVGRKQQDRKRRTDPTPKEISSVQTAKRLLLPSHHQLP